MIGRKAAVGLALLCALVFCAFAASSASAVKGTTAFTCAPVVGGAGFSDAHCKTAVTKNATFKHDAIAENTTTKTHITNEKTNATTTEHTSLFLHSTIFGVNTELRCTKVLGHSELTNDKNETTKEHTIHATKVTLHYTECDVLAPASCKVVNRTALTNPLTATSEGQGERLKFKAEGATPFAIVKVEGPFPCGNIEVTGSVTAVENGATLEFTRADTTAQNTLRANGFNAGLEGKATVRSAETTTKEGDAYKETGTPISSTTVET